MGQRIVFEFYGHTDRDREKWNQIKKLLSDSGGYLLTEPSGEPRTLIRASLPDEQRALEVAERLRHTDGVGRVSLTALRMAF